MKRIVVLGGGISGYGSAILAKKEGFDVFLSDSGRIADRFKARLDEWHVPYEEGGHTPELILSATEVVKSPGIPEKAPMVKALRERGIPIVSEIEFAGRYMGKARTMMRIVLPQAFKVAVPPMVNQFIITLKDTSILTVIGMPEIVNEAQQYIMIHLDYFETYICVALFYLVVISLLMLLSNYIEKKIGYDRKGRQA